MTDVRRWAFAAGIACGALLVAGCSPRTPEQLVAASQASLEKNDARTAVVHAKAALQQNPDLAAARFALGKALLRAGELTAAVVELEKAAALKHPEPEVLPLLARTMVLRGQARPVIDRFGATTLKDPAALSNLKSTLAAAYSMEGMPDRSEALLGEALALDPKNLVARLMQARLIASKGRADEAIALVDKLLADDARRHDAWHVRGELLWWGKGDASAASESYRKALEIEPRYLPAHRSLIWIALQKQDTKTFDATVDALKKALPGHIETRFYDTQAALVRRDLKQAREKAQQLLKVAPNDPRALQLAGAIELNAGSTVLAVTHLTKALQFAPRMGSLRHLLAHAHLRNGEPARALAALQPLLEAKAQTAETLSLAATAYMQNGQLARAEDLFAQAVKVMPDDAKVRTALAMTQIARGESEAGFADLEAVSKRDDDTVADLAIISARLRLKDLDGALKAAERLHEKRPGSAVAAHLRGQILLEKQDLSGARASFEKAIATDPKYYPSVAALVGLDMFDKKLEQAARRLEDHLVREPRSHQALTQLVEVKLRLGEKPDAVLARIAQAIKAHPTDVAPRLVQINLMLARNDFNAARNAAQEAVAAIPNDVMVLDALGRVQLASGDIQQALSSFGKVVAAQPASTLSHLRVADAHLANKDPASAAKSYQRALDIDEKLLPAQVGMAQIALHDRRYDESLALARTVQKQRPAESVGYLLEADVQLAQRRFEPAIVVLRKGLERERATTTAIRLHTALTLVGRAPEAETLASGWLKERPKDRMFLTHLGNLALEQRNLPAAEERFRAVIALNPNDATVRNNLAWLLLTQGKPGALEHAQRAHELAPKQPAILDTLAMALAADGKVPKALELQRQAVELAGGEKAAPTYRLNLAKLLARSGDKAAARAELQRLAYLGDKLPQQREVAELLKSLRD